MLSTAFIISVCLSVRLHQEVLEKLEECTKACKIVGPSCGESETCWCGACSALDLCAACNPGEACLGDTCYVSLFDDEQDTLSELTNSDCQCENGLACYWGYCIDTSEGDTDDEDDACYNCQHCWFGSYCLDPFDDMDDCSTACESVYCDDGSDCYCGECISDEEIDDTSSDSSDDFDHTTNERSAMFGLTSAIGALFFVIFCYCMYRKYLMDHLRVKPDSVKTKIRRPEVENYGRMDHPKGVPRITSGADVRNEQHKENSSSNECSLSSAGDCSSAPIPRRNNRRRHMHREHRRIEEIKSI